MAIPVSIEALINNQVIESNRIEFKAGWNPTPILHSICAFANDIDNIGGGYIVVGVEEENGCPKTPVIGLDKSRIDGILKELVGLCRCIEPLYNPIAEPVMYGDAHLIVIWVAGGYGRPYKVSKDVFNERSHKLYYIRKFSSTVVASPEEEKELFYVSNDIPFDDRPNLLARVEDLDIGLIREHLYEISSNLYQQSENMSVRELAQNMQLAAGPPENIHPLNVGILMFSEHPERYFRYARIEVVDIPDPTGQNMTEKVFTGPIQRQLKNALQYIQNHVLQVRITKTRNHAEADRVYNYPYAAVEEILSNAVYHRSYQVNEPITVRITPDRMEITSFPGFDRSITDRAIAERNFRARIYRNRRIGDFLKELHLIEGRNTGFPTAFKALKENGSPELLIEMDDYRTYLSVTIPIHPAFLSAKEQQRNTYAAKILAVLEEKPLTLTEIAHAMGYKGITAKLSRSVNEMMTRGLLRQVVENGSAKYTAARSH